jgi:hypothetical protein
VQTRSRQLRSTCETARKSERLEPAAAVVEGTRYVLIRSQQGGNLPAIEHLDVRASLLPLTRLIFRFRYRRSRVDRTDPTASSLIAIDLMARDQLEHQVRCGTDELAQAPTPFDSETALENVRFEFESRDYLAAVAPRSSPARLGCFEEHDVGARLRGV